MRILILGGNGMLGHQAFGYFAEKYNTKATIRGNLEDYNLPPYFTRDNTYTNIDSSSFESIEQVIDDFSPNIVLNAIGIIKQRKDAKSYIPSIEINSLLPHKLANLTRSHSARLIHLSTDCVFSGRNGNYSENDLPDARDLYGLSKLLGELEDEHCLTLRTSIIGLELSSKLGLIEWFLAQTGEINGFNKAIYTGFTTMELVRILEKIIMEYSNLHGIFHVASDPISKYDLLTKLRDLIDKDDITILPDNEFKCDRSLDSSRFNNLTGYHAPDWQNMLGELAEKIKARGK